MCVMLLMGLGIALILVVKHKERHTSLKTVSLILALNKIYSSLQWRSKGGGQSVPGGMCQGRHFEGVKIEIKITIIIGSDRGDLTLSIITLLTVRSPI